MPDGVVVMHKPSLRLGERLVQEGLVTPDHIGITLHEQRKTQERFGATLVKLGFLSDEKLAPLLAAHLGAQAVSGGKLEPDPEAMLLLPRTVAARCRALPLILTDTLLHLAMADPQDIGAMDEVRRYFPRRIDILPLVAAPTAIAEALENWTRGNADFDAILDELEGTAAEAAPQAEGWQHPIVRLVNNLLSDAVREGASDIHLEPETSFVRVRLRVDGVLRQKRALHRSHWPELSHRLKIMAGMNIADTRSMQDGRFHMQVGGAAIDFRMAVMPTVQGENIVIRILDHRRGLLPLEKLGYDTHALAQLDLIAARPEGVVLVTGPTGSGKTTTLYALLKRLNRVELNIMTLEEPVEYQFDMIRQTAIQEQQGLTFAEGVRGILRQAPDIIFIGEVRDNDTAQMALRAAMTGHQVFSTLHCNDVFGALPRLNDLGLSARMMAENIAGIVAQRLVRKLCPKCKKIRAASEEESGILKVPNSVPMICGVGFAEMQTPLEPCALVADPVGCEACGGTGYKGRIAVTEILRITPALDVLIAADAPRPTLRAQALQEGFRPMVADGIAKVLNLETSLDELRRRVDMTRIG